MIKKIITVITIVMFMFVASECFAYIVVAKEKNQTLYGRGKVQKDLGKFECHYEVDEENHAIYRKEVNNLRSGERIEDNTTYQIVENEIDISTGKKVIKAIGKPALGSLELLVIGEDFVLSCRSTADYFRITEMTRENVTKY